MLVSAPSAVPEIVLVNQGRCEEPSILRVDSDVFEVVLRCVAVGIPPPTMQWVFRDMVLVSEGAFTVKSIELRASSALMQP